MSESKAGLRESLELAIYREIGARDFYGAIAGKIVNPEGRERFMRLSSDEEGHRAKLVSWRERLFGGAFVTDPVKLRETEITGFEVDAMTGAMSALDIAIEAESRAADFYSERAGEASDGELKNLFLNLAEEEKGHYNLLQAEKNQLMGGFYWFDMDSSAFMEE